MNVYIYIMVLVCVNMYLLFLYIRLNSKTRRLERDIIIINLMLIKHLLVSNELSYDDLPADIQALLDSIEELSKNAQHKQNHTQS